MATYTHIELTEDEMLEAIIWGKQKKEAQINRQDILEKEKKNREFLTGKQWDFQQTRGFMLSRAMNIFDGKFSVDDSNASLFMLLCQYFSFDQDFISTAAGLGVTNPSLDKGIFLAGTFGTGKTWMMKLFSKNQRQVFHVKNAKAFVYDFSTNGDDAIKEHVEKIKNPVNDSNSFFHATAGICVDDIGTEDIANHYGNKRNVIAELLELRYAKGNIGPFLHATTNLTSKQLSEFYGGRVVSRMKEIFNFIIVQGGDRRK